MRAVLLVAFATAACAPDDQPIVFEVDVQANEGLIVTVDDNEIGGAGNATTTLTYELASVEDLAGFSLEASFADGAESQAFTLQSRCLEPGWVAARETHVLHAYRLEFLEPNLDRSVRCEYTNGERESWAE